MEVRIGWVLSSALVLVVGGGSVILLARVKRFFAAQVLSLLLLVYAFTVLLLWGTESKYFFTAVDLPPAAKRLLLASAGGLLAQLAIWLNRLARGKDKEHRIAPIYLDAIIGILMGLVAATLMATRRSSLTAISDQEAAVAGALGGALGVTLFGVLFEFAKPWLGLRIDNEQSAVPARPPKPVTCLYAGQEFSPGSNITMPGHDGGTIVKTCSTGRWQTVDRQGS